MVGRSRLMVGLLLLLLVSGPGVANAVPAGPAPTSAEVVAPSGARGAPAADASAKWVSRLSGPNRYATSAAISAATFAPGVPVAYLATGTDFPDALAAGPAARWNDGPILLTTPSKLPDETVQELKRLEPLEIVILGGTSAVSESVEAALTALKLGTVTRLSGPNRYATSAAISAATFAPGVPVAYLATGTDFPDALAAGPAGAIKLGPILLTTPSRLPDDTIQELKRLKPLEIIVLGGTSAVSEPVEAALAAYTTGTVTRLAGPNRYATSAAISAANFAPGVPVAYLATGTDFPDALAAGPAGGTSQAPILLTTPTALPPVTIRELKRLKPRKIIILGGTSTVSTTVEALLADYVDPIDTTAPGPVTNLTATAASITSIALTWTNPTDKDLTGILIRRSVGITPPASPISGVLVATTNATTTSYTNTGLNPGTTYSYAAFALDEIPNYSTRAIASATTTAGCAPVLHVQGEISTDETWGGGTCGSTYVVDSPVQVRRGATLTIEPGTVVKFAQGAGLRVGGTVQANGATNRIVFTSLRDDTVAGDTNGDGSATEPAAGDWEGITVSGGQLSLSDTKIAYGDWVWVLDASLTLSRSILSHGVHVEVSRDTASYPITIKDNTLTDVGNANSAIDVATVDAFDRDAHVPPTVMNNVVEGVRSDDPGTNCCGRAITVQSPYLDPERLSGNTGSGNSQNALYISGTLRKSVSLPQPGFPWVIGPSANAWTEPRDLKIPAGVTLTIGAAAVLKFHPGSGLEVEGSLKAIGTASEPVALTSIDDDSVGGDTNGNQGQTSPKAHDWEGIDATPGSHVHLRHVAIAYGRIGSWARTFSLTDSTLREGATVRAYRTNASHPITIKRNTLTKVGLAPAAISVQVQDTEATSTITPPSIINNTISGVEKSPDGRTFAGHAIAVSGASLDPTRLTGNSASGNGQNALFLEGTLIASANLPLSGLPWVVGPYSSRWSPKDLVIAEGFTLTAPAGTVLKFDKYARLRVEGTLTTNGSSSSRVRLTSVRDDTVGGDTNGDGNETQPAAGDWRGISIAPDGTFNRHRTDVRYSRSSIGALSGQPLRR